MMRKTLQWIAFAIAIFSTFGLVVAMTSGFHLSREDIRTILLIGYGISIVILLISLVLPKKAPKK